MPITENLNNSSIIDLVVALDVDHFVREVDYNFLLRLLFLG